MKFHTSSNNGVVAVISSEHAKLYATVKKAGGDPIAAGCRVFTFCSKERIERDLAERMVFSGTYEDLERLVKAGNHELIRGTCDWDGYVPFSNGYQYGYPLGGYPAAQDHLNETSHAAHELRYVTTLGDVIEAFGIVPQSK